MKTKTLLLKFHSYRNALMASTIQRNLPFPSVLKMNSLARMAIALPWQIGVMARSIVMTAQMKKAVL